MYMNSSIYVSFMLLFSSSIFWVIFRGETGKLQEMTEVINCVTQCKGDS